MFFSINSKVQLVLARQVGVVRVPPPDVGRVYGDIL